MVWDTDNEKDGMSDLYNTLFAGKVMERNTCDIEENTLENPMERICANVFSTYL